MLVRFDEGVLYPDSLAKYFWGLFKDVTLLRHEPQLGLQPQDLRRPLPARLMLSGVLPVALDLPVQALGRHPPAAQPHQGQYP